MPHRHVYVCTQQSPPRTNVALGTKSAPDGRVLTGVGASGRAGIRSSTGAVAHVSR